MNKVRYYRYFWFYYYFTEGKESLLARESVTTKR